MNINDLKQSNFLQKKDVEPDALVTIRGVSQENVAMEGGKPDMKWVIFFAEFEKGLVLNSTNGQIIAKITGSDESDDWSGHQIVLYHDPNVSFGGKLVGGIRVRAPKGKPVANKTTKVDAETGEEIPF